MGRIEQCPYCHEQYECNYYEQTPGFRFPEDKVCPYCGKVLETSLEHEFFTRKYEIE